MERVGLRHGYLENQAFAPQIVHGRDIIWARGARLTGRPYLARAAEEHSGPHMPWFWRGSLQGGGVLNDMMCHSVLLVRYLLSQPGTLLSSLRPQRVTAHIASLKWTRPEYVKRLAGAMGDAVDYAASPAEDFASVMIEFTDADGTRVLGEATTSWSFVGAGLRLSAELLGPEYSMSWSTLESGLKLFFSRGWWASRVRIWWRSRTRKQDSCPWSRTSPPRTATRRRTGTSCGRFWELSRRC